MYCAESEEEERLEGNLAEGDTSPRGSARIPGQESTSAGCEECSWRLLSMFLPEHVRSCVEDGRHVPSELVQATVVYLCIPYNSIGDLEELCIEQVDTKRQFS